MSYIVPSVLVSQALANAGGVSNSTPDLECCIIGPAYNVLTYTPGDIASQIEAAALSATQTTGSITSGTYTVTVVSTGGFASGDSVLVIGAGVSGANLQGTIVSGGISGNVITLDTAASTTVTGAVVTLPGYYIGTETNPTFALPNQLPGQVVDDTSIQVWLDNVYVDTGDLAVTGTAGSNSFTITTSGGFINLNSTTNTLNAEPGDMITYTTGTSPVVTNTTYIKAINPDAYGNSTNLNLPITVITTTDSFLGTTGATSLKINKLFSNQLLPATNPHTSGSNYVTTTVGTTGDITIDTGAYLVYGGVISANVYISYRALRQDLINRVLTINNPLDLVGQLGKPTEQNPLALAIELALANTTGRIRAITVASDDVIGHEEALVTAESERLYFIVPLTQESDILSIYEAHAKEMSTPANASWRVALVNTVMPLQQDIGIYNLNAPNTNSSNAITLVSGKYTLTSPSATFITDGVASGDTIYFLASSVGGQVGAHTVDTVVSNQQLTLKSDTSISATSTGLTWYISRNLSRTQTAEATASVSSGFNSNRVVHVQPDTVGVTINGVTTYLPGYYLAAALGGMGAGYPVQQGFTNIGVAGIADLQHSNYFYAKADLNTMAAAGTCLFVQDTQGGIPYCRHELTTNMTALPYRELLIVKELDFLSYFYYDKLKSFIGSWNITQSTLNTIRQTIVAASELIISQSLPQIGSVLLSYNIALLQQDPVNTDHVQCTITVAVGTPLNYIDLTLVV